MSDTENPTKPGISPLALTARIVAAHIGHNRIAAEALPALIQSVHQALLMVGNLEANPANPQAPAVPIKKSVFPDFIVCLEDGKKLKMLKRHLMTSYGLSPSAYREKWGLPVDYPMVAPAYARKRSDLAHRIGLGRKPSVGGAASDKAPTTEEMDGVDAEDSGEGQSDTVRAPAKAAKPRAGKAAKPRAARGKAKQALPIE